MHEIPGRQPESLTSDDDILAWQISEVLACMKEIDDAYEPGYAGPDISVLIQKMNKVCDPEAIRLVREARQRAARSRLTDQEL